ncbi:MAG: hypothetical protein MZV63_47225 [Marinilabiliales bacterium]|nr:hypothetical protein [Marinilabiliales bacterium]
MLPLSEARHRYTYKWTPLTGLDDSNIKTPTAKPAVTTTYTVTVTDANGCQATNTITITVRPALTLTLAVDDSSIGTCPTSEAHITSTAGGGEPGYIYLWTPAAGLSSATDPNPTAKPAATTTYTLTVTDQNGCTISRDITINGCSCTDCHRFGDGSADRHLSDLDEHAQCRCPRRRARLYIQLAAGSRP